MFFKNTTKNALDTRHHPLYNKTSFGLYTCIQLLGNRGIFRKTSQKSAKDGQKPIKIGQNPSKLKPTAKPKKRGAHGAKRSATEPSARHRARKVQSLPKSAVQAAKSPRGLNKQRKVYRACDGVKLKPTPTARLTRKQRAVSARPRKETPDDKEESLQQPSGAASVQIFTAGCSRSQSLQRCISLHRDTEDCL